MPQKPLREFLDHSALYGNDLPHDGEYVNVVPAQVNFEMTRKICLDIAKGLAHVHEAGEIN
jgi:hypothetical protein